MTSRNPETAKRQIGIGELDRGGEWRNNGGEASGGDYPRLPSPGPLCRDSSHDAVNRVGRAEQHAGLNALFGSPADYPSRRTKLGRR